MDWSKAKTILIVAFLITNIILGLVLYTNNKEQERLVTDEFLKEVEELLLEKDIRIDTKIPKENPSLAPLIVEYEIMSPDKVNDVFFQSRGIIEEAKRDYKIVYRDETVSISQNKRLKYEKDSGKEGYLDLDKDKALNIFKDFIRSKDLYARGMELESISETDGEFEIIYNKKHKGVYLENSYIYARVNNSGLVELEKVWLNVLEEGDRLISTTPPYKAILELLSKEEVYGKTIKDISICHYFNPEEHDYLETSKNAKKGKTITGWRILFKDNTRLILDSY